jgi:hypothetical protein
VTNADGEGVQLANNGDDFSNHSLRSSQRYIQHVSSRTIPRLTLNIFCNEFTYDLAQSQIQKQLNDLYDQETVDDVTESNV